MGYKTNQEQLKIKNQISHFIRIGHYEKIKVPAADLISKFPSYPYGYYAMSFYEYYHKRIDNAIELCHKSMEYGMSQLAAGVLLMLYYNDKHDYQGVDAEFHSVKQQFPYSNEALAIYGYSLWQRGRKDEGSSILKEAFSNNPSDPMVIRYLFIASRKNKNSNDLDTFLKLYINTGASDKQKLTLAGLNAIRTNKWKEARECFGRVLGMDPTDAEALHYMKIIEVRKRLPELFLVAIGYGVLVYFFRFDPQTPLTYLFFLPSLIFLALLAAAIVRIMTL